MNYRDLWRVALKSLRAHKLRSFLTLLGIIIGLMTIVVIVGGISGVNRYIASEMSVFAPDTYDLGRFGMITSRKEWIEALKRPPITWSDYERVSAATFLHTADVAAEADTSVDVSCGSKRIKGMTLTGVTGNFGRVASKIPEQGSFFSEPEERIGARVAVIGEETRAALFPTIDPIGRTMLIRGVPFRVVGLMPQKSGGLDFGPTDNTCIFVPISAYRQSFMVPGEGISMKIKAKGVESMEASQDEVRALMRALRHTPFRASDPFGIVTFDALMDLWKSTTRSAFLVMILISGISLTVGGVVIMNIMLVSVAERTQEIGQRRAIGARQRDIRLQFLLEAALLSATGGVIGILVGSGIVGIIRFSTGFPAVVTPGIVLMGLLVSTLVGVLAGYLPARRASQLLVIDALRAE